jgi:hypothetical protein
MDAEITMDSSVIGGILGGAAGVAAVLNSWLDGRKRTKDAEKAQQDAFEKAQVEQAARTKETEWNRLRELVEDLDHQLGNCYDRSREKDLIIDQLRTELHMRSSRLSDPPPSGSPS